MFAGKSLGSLFVDVLDQYVPLDMLTSSGYRDIPSFRVRVKQLYATRSMITHGTGLLGGDTADAGFLPRQNQQDGDLRTLVGIMPYALGTWLTDHGTMRYCR